MQLTFSVSERPLGTDVSSIVRSSWHFSFFFFFYSTVIQYFYTPQNIVVKSCQQLISCPVMFDSLQPHGLQHAMLPCPSLSPEVHPSSCPLHQWCHPAISFSDALFSFCLQSFPASRTFPMSQLFISDDQNTGVSALASVLPMSIQFCCSLRLRGLISLLCNGLSRGFSSTTVERH